MKKIVCVLLILSLSGFAAAKEQLMVSPLLLLNPSHFLPMPPEEGSDKAVKELSFIKALNASSTDATMEKAAQDAVTRDVLMFQKEVPKLNLEKMPYTKEVFREVAYNEERVANRYKDFFQRKRPYQLDNAIKTCVPSMEKSNFASYPSSHSAMAFSMAIVLSELYPGDAERIMARAQEYAHNRMICGVHHKSDIEAGQVLGSVIASQLLMNKDFLVLLSKAIEEVNAQPGAFDIFKP